MKDGITARKIKQQFGITTEVLKSFNLECRISGQSHLFEFSEVRDAWYQYKFLKDNRVMNSEGEIDRNREEAELIRERKINLQLKNKKALGEQADIVIMEAVLGQIMTATKARVTSMPLNVKRLLPETHPSVLKVIENEVITASNDIAAIRIDWPSIEGADI